MEVVRVMVRVRVSKGDQIDGDGRRLGGVDWRDWPRHKYIIVTSWYTV